MYSSLLSLFFIIIVVPAQRIEYLNGLFENNSCQLEPHIYGICRRLPECLEEFESHRKNKTILKVCRFATNIQDHLICCPRKEVQDELKSDQVALQPEASNIFKDESKFVDLTDFESCQAELKDFRIKTINTDHLANAMIDGVISITEDNCQLLNRINEEAG